MNKRKLTELIKKLVNEYTGTGASGGNAGDGNNITSPRPFADDLEELENYLHKNIYGGEGGHYRKDSDPFNYNRQKMGMFEQAYGSATLTTQGVPSTRAIRHTDEYPFSVRPKRTATGMMEFKEPKSFDPDTIRLVREMLEVADIHHDELVNDADTDEISTFLDKRSGGTFIKFPHFNGPEGRGALFGKDVSDQIERSKAAAKAAALKTYTQFKTYIEDYEISDVSPAGVYGNIYLFLIFNPLAKDYTAPKGGTQSSQFEEKMENLKERFQQLAGIKPLYEAPTTYGDASTLGSDDNIALKSQTHFLNSIAILDLEDKYRNKRVFSDKWGFGDFEYDIPNARVYWHLDSNAMGNVYDDDKDFYYDLKTKDFVMDKYMKQNYWNVLPPEDKKIWEDIKDILDKNIIEKQK